MSLYTVTVKNGCKRCGKDAYIKFKKDSPDLPALQQGVSCESKCLGGGVLDDETINGYVWLDPPQY